MAGQGYFKILLVEIPNGLCSSRSSDMLDGAIWVDGSSRTQQRWEWLLSN